MPELPEGECTVRYLAKKLRGRKILDVKVLWPRIIDRPSARKFSHLLKGRKFKSFSRRGKYIVLELEGIESKPSLFLIAHLRMSGSFDVLKKGSLRSKHDQVVFLLDKERELRFHDIRKFGRIYALEDKEILFSKLGLEPFDLKLRAEDLYKLISNIRSPVKSILLRQDILAGVGNIYADEALWAAALHPLLKGNRIKPQQVSRLLSELRKILSKAIKANGTDNGDGVVYGGMYAPRAYGRAGLKCFRCKGILKRIVVAQRGTTFCPGCQKA